jgi:hypothetical protein
MSGLQRQPAAQQPGPIAAQAMLDAAGPLSGAHALVIGHAALDVLCGLIGRGCSAAVELQPDAHLPGEPAEIVLVPDVENLDMAAWAIAQARRSLLPCGRMVMLERTGRLSAQVSQMLRSAGFSGVKLRPGAEGTLITADWPMFGRLHREAGRA